MRNSLDSTTALARLHSSDTGWHPGVGLWETVCMAEKRTKSDKGRREADRLEKKSSHRPPQKQGKKAREDFRQAAVRMVEEAEGTVGR